MSGTDFKRSAELGCRVYGDDPWFFLRELSQNSRDAGATRIDVEASWERLSLEVVRFTDDGAGMDLEHARKYLFRLYSSSKEDDPRAAGMYGIGFWSVLMFGPSHILLESKTGDNSWAISISPDFKLRQVDCHLKHSGTRVTLVRQARSQSEARFVSDLRSAASRFGRYLRRNDRDASPLPMFIHDQSVARPFDLSGPVTLAFKQGPVEGVVGLAEEPRVELYARGLPVWSGLLLDELSHSAKRNRWRSEIARGLSPAFLLNGNALNVIMSRNAVVDDRELARVKKTASRSLNRLVRQHLERTFPSTLFGALTGWLDRIRQLVFGVRPLFWVSLGLAMAVIVAAFWVTSVLLPVRGVNTVDDTPAAARLKEAPGTAGGNLAVAAGAPRQEPCGLDDVNCRRSARMLPGRYEGAVVSRSISHRAVDLSYTPGGYAWFKILTASRYTSGSGLLTEHGRLETAGPMPEYSCRNLCLAVRLALPHGGRTVLPAPSGYQVVPGSIMINERPRQAEGVNGSGECLVTVPDAGGVVEYSVGPPETAADLPAQEFARLTVVQESPSWPAEVESIVSSALVLPVEERVLAAAQTARALVSYDRSEETVLVYEAGPDSADWLTFVLGVGQGDCDVINGVMILLLRRMNVPARLAVGLVGDNGRVVEGLHAWTEYWDQGWHTLDASRQPVPAAAVGQRPASPVGPAMAPVPPSLGHAVPGADGSSGNTVADVVLQPAPMAASEDPSPASSGGPSPLPPPASTDGIEADSGGGSNAPRFGWWPLVIALLSGISGLWLLVSWARGRNRQESSTLRVADPKSAQALLAQMAMSALVTPRAWRQAQAIWFHRILPTLGPTRISISRARRMARKGRLFAGTRRNSLAAAAHKAGAVVLDLSNEPFAQLINTLSGIVNLDDVSRLDAVETDPEESQGFEPLTAMVNRVFAACRIPVSCLVSAQMEGEDFRDVDLTGLPATAKLGLPARFIVLNSEGAQVKKATELFARKSNQGAFWMLDLLASRSLLLCANARRIRHKAALLLLKEEP